MRGILPRRLAKTASVGADRTSRARKRKVFSNNTITMADLSTPCIACGATKQVEGDHRVPLAMGGANRLSNYWPLCKPCNTSKGARLWEEWIAEQGIK